MDLYRIKVKLQWRSMVSHDVDLHLRVGVLRLLVLLLFHRPCGVEQVFEFDALDDRRWV